MFIEFKDTDGKSIVINSERIVYYRPTENHSVVYIQLTKSEENKDFIHVSGTMEMLNRILKIKKMPMKGEQ